LDYKARHDNVAKILLEKMALKYHLLNESTPCYKHNSSQVLENNPACLYWERGILTDKTVSYNRSNITLYGKPIKIVYSIDGSTTNSSYLETTYTEK
jgi:ribonucleotide monophosphatase NagD (HAD superfamily)